MTYLVNQTKSYTLVVSTETGEMRLELADDLKENLTEMLAEADTSTDGLAALLDVLGEDAAALLDAMGQIYGVGGELAGAFGQGGPEAVEALLAELAANGPAADLMDRVGEKDGFGGFGSGFVEMPASDVEDILGYGTWDGPNHNDFNPNADVENASNPLVPIVIWGGVILLVTGIKECTEDKAEKKVAEKAEPVTFIPADPDAEYGGYVDFTPFWVTEDYFDPTYGQILTDPNSESGVEGNREHDPEDELAREILTDPEAEQREITAAEAAEAAGAHIVNTTLPADPDEPEFDWNPDIRPDIGGGEDFTGSMDGDQVSATATEYIVAMQGSEDDEIGLEDTMIVNTNLQVGGVEGEGTSSAMLDGQLPQEDAAPMGVEHML